MKRIDELKNGLKIIQDPKKFCFGIDAVLLADFAASSNGKKPKKICDLCSGNGIIPLLLAKKYDDAKIFGIEIQSDVAEMAKKSIEANNLNERIKIVNGDLKEMFSKEGDLKFQKEIYADFEKNAFDAVTVNPPYMILSDGRNSKTDNMSIARHEVMCNLEDVVSSASGLLNSHGKLFMIHKPFRLVEIFSVMTKYKMEPKRMQLIHPFRDKEPTMVLIEAEKCGKGRIKIEPPVFVE